MNMHLNQPEINRRRLLGVAFLATPAVLAAPLAVAAAEASPIQRLYREHKAIYFAPGEDVTDEACVEMDRIEAELLALPVRSIADLAAKALVVFGYGDLGGLGRDAAFWREIVALTEAH